VKLAMLVDTSKSLDSMKQCRILIDYERYAANLLVYPHGEWYVKVSLSLRSKTNLHQINQAGKSRP
jgi:hypothetical protein